MVTLVAGATATEERSGTCSNTVEPLQSGPLKYRHLSNQDRLCGPSGIETCTTLPLKSGHLHNVDTFQGPMVSGIERFHCDYKKSYRRGDIGILAKPLAP